MNHQNRFTCKLLQYFYFNKNTANKGFALPMIIGLGLIMTVTGLTMIIRSSDEEVLSEQQQQTAQAQATAETGITRMQRIFLAIPELALQDFDDWDDEIEDLFGGINNIREICSEDGEDKYGTIADELDDLLDSDQGWINRNNGGSYTIENYTYDGAGQGQLIIDGTSEENLNNNNDDNLSNVSRIAVNIPVEEDPDQPSLWVRQFDDDNDNDKLGETNQYISGGNVQSSLCDNNVTDGEDFDPSKNLADQSEQRLNNNPLREFPDMPDPQELADKNDDEKRIDCGDDTLENCIDSGSGGGNTLTLPRSSDEEEGINTYSYDNISGIGQSGNTKIEVDQDCDCNVRLFVDGDIELRGTPDMGNPEQLQTYVRGTQEVRLRGTADVAGFLFAPNSRVGVKGNGAFAGPVWANNWAGNSFGSSSNQNVIDIGGDFDWNALPDELRSNLPKVADISPSQNFQRQPVD